ncbi:MAG: cobyric acid synthase [Rickettsiales bacterium]
MSTSSVMFQGTGSDVGKSLLVAGFCRLLARRGLKVLPFKAQNMSNNAAVADDGGEIGRAQWLQALAAGVAPSVNMNPVLLKPQSDKTSQVIVHGKVVATMGAADYQDYRMSLMPAILESYNLLQKQADIVLVEGAGSPAEINLRKNDIANMGFALAANCPVVMIGDIERGGVIASLVGTHSVLSDADRKMIKGFIVNKFRGDAGLFTRGAIEIEKRTAWQNLGLVPYYADLAKLPQEDSLGLRNRRQAVGGSGKINISVLRTPYIANFDDIDPLMGEENAQVRWVRAGEVIPADSDIVILAGSKATIADLKFIRKQGWDIDLTAHRRRGGRIIGICGGYQMLGKTISDPDGIEGEPETAYGLGMLEIDTILTAEKVVRNVSDTGYEIHAGKTKGADISADGLVWGSYVHGIFASDEFRNSLLKINSSYNYKQHTRKILDDWADVLAENVNIEELLKLAR